ncbi:MAG: hypothetical protein P4L53_06735 [Candidatus Obscuribacterales bacterium]|nr:hypothetical protein [Candidatus Obscuribacterales bacterium]
MEIEASIKGITYQPFLCKTLSSFSHDQLREALAISTTFLYSFADLKQVAISIWLSPKRTRSYPYSRVYDSLSFGGRKVTIIPLVKDEGADGDCDYLQWDTVALMGLLGIYVIPAYYDGAQSNPAYKNKITNQLLSANYLEQRLIELENYHSSALHWNLEQFERLSEVGELALAAYQAISNKLNVQLRSTKSLLNKMRELKSGKEDFLSLSRLRSQSAQRRESNTVQPKEFFSGNKASVTIVDSVGGTYFLTADHCEIVDDVVLLVESKHSNTRALPAMDDIKDGLIKMTLFSNLTSVHHNSVQFKPLAVLRLAAHASFNTLTDSQVKHLTLLQREAVVNGFRLDLSGVNGFKSIR